MILSHNVNSKKRILISAGELSGDMHAATLVQAVKKLSPAIEFYGMGANLMQKAGVDIIVNAGTLSIIGGLEIITKFVKIFQAFRIMKQAICRDLPDLIILVDYPGFNLRLAKIAKKTGIKVLYFISPKIWAWHQSRIKIIQECVDKMAVIFPFEVDFYQKHQVDVSFVGNPTLEHLPKDLATIKARQLLNLNSNAITVGLFPGSRLGEIKRLLPIMLKTAKILHDHEPNIRFLLARASSITSSDLEPYLHVSNITIQVVTENNYATMHACNAIIAASGTTTLEIALVATPLVVIYKMSWLEYQLAKRLIKIPYVSLVNILAQKPIVQELLQCAATPEKIAAEIEKILHNSSYRNEMISNLKNIKNLLEEREPENLALLTVNCFEIVKPGN